MATSLMEVLIGKKAKDVPLPTPEQIFGLTNFPPILGESFAPLPENQEVLRNMRAYSGGVYIEVKSDGKNLLSP